MYDELIGRLHRYTENCVSYKLDADFASAVQEAADAIEELSEQLDEETEYATALSYYVPQWIPCSERLPKENEDVLVYLWDRQVPYLAWVDTEGRWETNDFYIDIENKPKAWMPLPKPYEPPKEE